MLAHQVSHHVATGLARLGVDADAGGRHASTIPDLSTLPAPVRGVFEAAFGDATGRVFLIATPFAVAAFVAVLFIKEVPLRTTIERENERAQTSARSAG